MIVSIDEIISMDRKINFDRYIPEVRAIIQDVRERVDSALLEYTEKFDSVKLKRIKVSDKEFSEAEKKMDDDFLTALEIARQNIERFHREQLKNLEFEIDMDGYVAGRRASPLESVGLYIPGGRANYPSTALMSAIPPLIAGVGRIVACTPPDSTGKANPYVLTALRLCGVDDVYKVGGAQAISAMAYGTETIPSVDKIAGPGNIYVTVAKMLVRNDVEIDFPAGPSEILILADESANPEFIAYDMLAQMEHDPLAISILVTTSEKIGKEVESILRSHDIASGQWRIAIAGDMDEAITAVNGFAPEHLSIFTEDPWREFRKVRNAGCVFLGKYSPVSAGDYISGTNHILPTSGFARVFSGLGVEHFLKSISYQKISKEALKKMEKHISIISKVEGLKYHDLAVKVRFDEKIHR